MQSAINKNKFVSRYFQVTGNIGTISVEKPTKNNQDTTGTLIVNSLKERFFTAEQVNTGQPYERQLRFQPDLK